MHEFHPAQRINYSHLCVCCRGSDRAPLSNSVLLVSISPICTWEGFLFCLCLSCKYANLDLCVCLWVFVNIHICRNMCVLTYVYRNAIAPDYFQVFVEIFFFFGYICAESFFPFISVCEVQEIAATCLFRSIFPPPFSWFTNEGWCFSVLFFFFSFSNCCQML